MALRRARPGHVRWFAFLAPIAITLAVVASCGSGGDQSDDGASTPETQSEVEETSEQDAGSEPTAPGTTTGDQEPASDGVTGEETAVEDDIEPVEYAGDFATSIQPIFADRCASCHSPGGPGTSHWTLDTVDDIATNHEAIASLVSSGAMPPWPADGDSPSFHGDRSLRDDQIQAIVAWSEDGGAIDTAGADPVEPLSDVVRLTDPDLTMVAAEPYAGSKAATDDYRCQIYDPELADGGWITGYEFLPDQTEVVHHAIGYLLPAEAREAAAQLDGADGKPGWECYGSSGLGEDDLFLGWAPGQLSTEMPDGTGLWVEPGAFFVVQIHYHYHHHLETEAPADLSALALELELDEELEPLVISEYLAPAEIPCSSEESGPLCDRDAAMANAVERYGNEGVLANDLLRLCGSTVEDYSDMTDGTASASCDLPVVLFGGLGEIVSVFGHEHEIGAWFRLTLNPGTPDEKVLLDITDWDFDWQYNYEPVESIIIDADDTIRIECGWDRARRDPELEPAYVLWADGTNDEMCFATITTRPV